MLQLNHCSISIAEKPIIFDFSFSFLQGNVYVILGENGSGKSSLAFALFRHPRYTLTGSVLFGDVDITTLSPDLLAKEGMFLSFQNIPEIPGIRLIEYLRTVYVHNFTRKNPDKKPPTPFIFRRMLEKMLPEYGLDSKFLDRDLYVGFSGGEKRRIEMLQVDLLDPDCIVLDEIDSGLDIGAIDILSHKINAWKEKGKLCIIISHNFHLLDSLKIDGVLIMNSGKLEKTGGKELISKIREDGF